MVADNPHILIYAVEHERKYVGNIVYHYDVATSEAYFQMYLGDPHVRGKGIGTAAMQASMTAVYQVLPIRKIVLDVFDGNMPALQLYEKLGFRKQAAA